MAISPVIRGTVKKGRFFPYIVELFKKAFMQYDGKEVEVVVRLPKNSRTNQQNRYMWGVVYALISQYTGEEPDSIHDYLVARFAPKVDILGSMLPKKTSKMSTVEMENYLTEIRTWASQFLGVFIPLPNECDY